jgi:hypothetical protein
MNGLLIGLGAAACLAFAGTACAANGSIAASMARDYWISVKKNEELAKRQPATRVSAAKAVVVVLTRPAPPR